MSDLQFLNTKVNAVKNLMKQLSSAEFNKEADPELLLTKFLLLNKKYQELAKLTNNGKASPELKTKNLKIIKKWLDNYSTTAEAAISGLPQKYKNKNVVLNNKALTEITYFRNYIPQVLDYMDKLEPRYQAIKNMVEEIMEKGKTLATHLNKFLITEDDIPGYDYFAADDQERKIYDKPPPVYQLTGNEPEVTPTKMISSIQTILNKYQQFSVRVGKKYDEIMDLVDQLDDLDLGEFLTRTNQRNKLIKQLLRDLVEVNRILYQDNIPHKEHFREEYYQLVDLCLPLLPEHISNRLAPIIKQRKGKGKMEMALEQSLDGIKKYDPSKDKAMKFQSPHIQSYVKPEEKEKPGLGNLKDRIDRKLRHKELEEISNAGKPLTPEEKAKYESMWTSSAGNHISNLLKIANKFENNF